MFVHVDRRTHTKETKEKIAEVWSILVCGLTCSDKFPALNQPQTLRKYALQKKTEKVISLGFESLQVRWGVGISWMGLRSVDGSLLCFVGCLVGCWLRAQGMARSQGRRETSETEAESRSQCNNPSSPQLEP
jgi:hypothetical protein